MYNSASVFPYCCWAQAVSNIIIIILKLRIAGPFLTAKVIKDPK